MIRFQDIWISHKTICCGKCYYCISIFHLWLHFQYCTFFFIKCSQYFLFVSKSKRKFMSAGHPNEINEDKKNNLIVDFHFASPEYNLSVYFYQTKKFSLGALRSWELKLSHAVIAYKQSCAWYTSPSFLSMFWVLYCSQSMMLRMHKVHTCINIYIGTSKNDI